MLRAKRRRSGFTVIELLVVVAVVAILAGLLFPVLVQAKGQAQRTRCLSNLKELGTACLMYVNDWQGSLPHPGGSYLIRWAWDQDIHGGVDAYLKAKGMGDTVWRCPGAQKPTFTGPPPTGEANSYGRSYCMNDYLRAFNYGPASGWTSVPPGRPLHGLKESQLQCPSRTIMLFETYQDPDSGYMYAYRNGSMHFPGPGGLPMCMHGGRMEVLYCDGHAASVYPPDTWAGTVQGRFFKRPFFARSSAYSADRDAPRVSGTQGGDMPDNWVPFWPYANYPSQ